MTNNIRQEAVEQAATHWAKDRGDNEVSNLDRLVVSEVLDASGLIEQLTEAIARRDKYREQLAKVVDQRDEAETLLEEVWHHLFGASGWTDADIEDWAHRLSAHRATERSDG